VRESLKSLFGHCDTDSQPISAGAGPREGRTMTLREGKFVPTDEVFDAWTSSDLPRMLAAIDMKSNLIDRHFLLMGIVKETYRLREDPAMADLCAEVAQTHVDEFATIKPALEREFGGQLPRVPTFQHYATLLTERGDFTAATRICEAASAFGLDDGTKAGYAGRIARIGKKAAIVEQGLR